MKSKNRIFMILVVGLVPLFLTGCCSDKPPESKISERVFEYTIINASPEEVWDYAWGKGILMDQATGKATFEWYPRGEFSDFHGQGVGSSDKYVVDIEGKKYTGSTVTIEEVPGRKQVSKWFGDIEGTWIMLCVPFENGTKLIIVDEYSLVVKPGTSMSIEELADLLKQDTLIELKTIKDKVEGK